MRVQHCNAFIPTLVSFASQWSTVKLIFMSLCLSLSISISVRLRRFLEIIRVRPVIARRACVRKRIVYPLTGVWRTPVGSNWNDMSLCISISLYGHLGIFVNQSTAHNCTQRIQLQATGSNPLRGSIICWSVGPSVWSSAVLLQFCIYINFQCGFHLRDAFITFFSIFIYIYIYYHLFYVLLWVMSSFWFPPGFWINYFVTNNFRCSIECWG